MKQSTISNFRLKKEERKIKIIKKISVASLEEIREAAAQLCRDYLNGRWKEVTSEQLVVKKINGGLSNFLYYISLPEEDKKQINQINVPALPNIKPSAADLHDHTEPREVLLRIYGQSHGEDALEGIITQSVVFALLSERNFGPKLHGIFPGGRIEQYLPTRPLATKELAIPKISKKIAEKMGEIHSLNIPMSKEPEWLWNCMDRWLKSIDSILGNFQDDPDDIKRIVKDFNYIEAIKWLKNEIDQTNFKVLFCHNDLQEGNILFFEGKEEDGDHQNNNNIGDSEDFDLVIIDFEYCAYNYRGFDLANHFLEWSFDYTYPELPFFHYYTEQYPTKQQRETFITTYLRKLNEGVAGYEPSPEELEGIEYEVRVFSMFSHLFWTLWSVVNINSNIEFGYWEYAAQRISEFQRLKQEYINGYRK